MMSAELYNLPEVQEPKRRSVMKGMAWSAPVVMAASATPAFASSTECEEVEALERFWPNVRAGIATEYIDEFVIPAGVTRVSFEIAGGSGGGSSADDTQGGAILGGGGAVISGSFEVSADATEAQRTIKMIIGSGGVYGAWDSPANPGGTGYGQGGSTAGRGGSGGGGTAILLGSTLMAVAGGGGGRGVATNGGGAGTFPGAGGAGGLNGVDGGDGQRVHPDNSNWVVKAYGGSGAVGGVGGSGGIVGDGGGTNPAPGNDGGNHGTGLHGGGDGGNGVRAMIPGFPGTSGGGGGGYAGGGSGSRAVGARDGQQVGAAGGGGSSYINFSAVNDSKAITGGNPGTEHNGNAGWVEITYLNCI